MFICTDFINNSPFDIIEANDKTVKLGILGNVTELIKALDKYKVLDLDTEKVASRIFYALLW